MYEGKRSENRRGGARVQQLSRREAARNLTRRLVRIAAVCFVLSMVCFLIFLREMRSYQRDSGFYQTLAEETAQAIGTDAPEQGGSRMDFSALLERNGDTAAWLDIPGLGLALPVVWCGDNETYLKTAFDGSSSRNGCLFLSAQAQPDFSLPYQVIYGHHIHNGSMFGDLADYKKREHWQQYPTFALYTPEGDYLCTIFSCHNTQDRTEVYRVDWQVDEEYAAFLGRLQEGSLYDTGVSVDENSRVLTLSTCDSPYSGGMKRFVVHAVMEPLE